MKKAMSVFFIVIGAAVFLFSVWLYNDHMVEMYESKYYHDLNSDGAYLTWFGKYLKQMQTKIGILALIGISIFLAGYTLLIKEYVHRKYKRAVFS